VVAIINVVNMNNEFITPEKFHIMGRIMTETEVISKYANAFFLW